MNFRQSFLITALIISSIYGAHDKTVSQLLWTAFAAYIVFFTDNE